MQASRLRLSIVTWACALAVSACCGTAMTGNLLRANGRYQEGNFTGAIELADHVLAQDPESAEVGAQAALLKGLSLERLGRTSEARAVYEHIADRYPQSTTGAQARGRLQELSRR